MIRVLAILLFLFAPLATPAFAAGPDVDAVSAAAASAAKGKNFDPRYSVKPKLSKPEKIVEFHSKCRLCRFIVLLSDQISYVFNKIYAAYSELVLIFLFVFGCFALAQSVWKGMGGLPFKDNIMESFREMNSKTRMIFIASVLAIIPPQTLFQFTFAPIMSFSYTLARTTLTLSGVPSLAMDPDDPASCQPKPKLDSIRAERRRLDKERIMPPALRSNRMFSGMEDAAPPGENPVIEDGVVGGAICLLSDMQRANARFLMAGQVMFFNSLNFTDLGWWALAIGAMGAFIFTLFFLINLYMAFYILDGLVDVLELAILWPLMVFGYAFEWIGFSVSRVKDVALRFGTTLVSLAIFTMFNVAMLGGFMLAGGDGGMTFDQLMKEVLDTGDTKLLLRVLPHDLKGMTQFMFMVFVGHYLYSKISDFVASFGARIGGDNQGFSDKVKNALLSPVMALASAKRVEGGDVRFKKEKKEKPAKEKGDA